MPQKYEINPYSPKKVKILLPQSKQYPLHDTLLVHKFHFQPDGVHHQVSQRIGSIRTRQWQIMEQFIAEQGY